MADELATKIYQVPPLTDSVVIAHLWLLRGWSVIPCQPDTKEIIAGFGPHLATLQTAEQIEEWFRLRKCNIAVCAPEHHKILDFDDAELYEQFQEKCPHAAKSLTERTPRGGAHVFIQIAKEISFEPVKGLEIRIFAMVYPSVVAGKRYGPSVGKIEYVDLRDLQGFGVIKHTSPSDIARPRASQGQIEGDFDLIAKVKTAWPIMRFLCFFAVPTSKTLIGMGRWRRGICPFHDDHKPSLWVDVVNNTWGCHACTPRTQDVVDWWSRAKGLPPGKAAKDLLHYAEAVKFEW